MKTKIAFNDIPNVIERDEMKEVVGGFNSIIWGNTSTSNSQEMTTLLVVMEDGGPIKIPIYIFGGVALSMPKDTKFYIELKNIDVFQNSDSKSPNYDPYGQWTANTIAEVLQNIGDSISAGGITLSATGVGAGAGVPMMTIGGVISKTGTALEFLIDANSNTWASFNGEKWLIKGALELINYGAGNSGMPEGAEAYYNSWSIGAGRGIDYMTEFRDPN